MFEKWVGAAVGGSMALVLAGSAQAAVTTVFSQDFSEPTGPAETISGNFSTANGYLGHAPAVGYQPNERSFYEVLLDLTGLTTAFISFDWTNSSEKNFDGWNVKATTGEFVPFLEPLDAINHVYNSNTGFGRAFTGVGAGSSVIDLSAFAGQATRVRFNFYADYAAQGPGVQFDNLRVYGEAAGSSGAVPEPATWAMMLLGFGAMGAAIRRRRLWIAA